MSGRWRTRDRRWLGQIIPEPEEQTAFAAILFDMDAEIVALVKVKVAKARNLKQDMMQELLNGKIRLA